jgi:Ca-activated chloride channel family protein
MPGELARLAAAVTWRTLDGPFHRAEVAVETPVVEDPALVERSLDQAVFSRGIAAVGSEKMLAAVAAWERGDSSSALGLLDNARALFGMSADALAGSDVDEVRQRLSKPASAQEKREYQRGYERKKLTNFGLENSGY